MNDNYDFLNKFEHLIEEQVKTTKRDRAKGFWFLVLAIILGTVIWPVGIIMILYWFFRWGLE